MSHPNMGPKGSKLYPTVAGLQLGNRFSAETDNSNKPYDLAIVMGRFECPHVGHGLLFNKAKMIARNTVIFIGSADSPRTIKNPFTYDERVKMIQSVTGLSRYSFYPINDFLYSDPKWIEQVQENINLASSVVQGPNGWSDKDCKLRICIVGNKKDESSEYLNWFPQCEYVDVNEFKMPGLDATNIRSLMFEDAKNIDLLKGIVPSLAILEALKEFSKTPEYARLVREYNSIKADKEKYGSGPFLTADSMVTKAGHVLLVERGEGPGEGLWALPGGFVNLNERIFSAALRELSEETNIDVPPAIIKGSFVKSSVYDHPNRSLRGRVVTTNHWFNLDGHDKNPGLPKTRAADDAHRTFWLPFNEIKPNRSMFHEDHNHIIVTDLGL